MGSDESPEPLRLHATDLILGALTLAWTVSALAGGEDPARRVVEAAGCIAPEVWAGAWWRLGAALFLLGDFFELMLLGSTLLVCGRWLEARMGAARLVLIFVGGGLAGQLAGMSLEASPFVGGPEAISSVLGASLPLLLSPRAPRDGERMLALGCAIFGLCIAAAGCGHVAIAVSVAWGAASVLVLGTLDDPPGWGRYLVLLALSALIAGAAVRALDPDPSRVAEYEMQRGTDAYRAGDVREAVARWSRAVDADPTFGAAWYNLSVGYAALHLPQAAERALDEASRLSPALPELLGRLGERESQAGHPRRAEEIWRMLLRQQPDQSAASLALADALAAQGSVGAAAAVYDAQCAAHPTDHAVLLQAAAFYDDVGADTQKAAALWQRLARLPAADAEDALRVARAQLMVGDASAARETVTRFLGSDAADVFPSLKARLLVLRANARAEAGRFEEALADCEQAAALALQGGLAPDWASAYLRARLGFWWARDVEVGRARGTAPPAAPAWEEASRLASSDYERDLTAGYEALAVRRDAAAAEAAGRRVVERRPRDAEGRYLLGLALAARGRVADGRAEIARAAALQPGDREFREAAR